MGYAIAKSLAERGALVILISGHVMLPPIKHKNIKLIKVLSAEEMKTQVFKYLKKADGFIFAAAVSDYKPIIQKNKKIKREKQNELTITLTKNPDIAFEVGKVKKDNQISVGFALETDNFIENAQKKLKSKNLDFIVLNTADGKTTGFGTDTNKITIIDKYNKVTNYKLKTKSEVAEDIVDYLQNFKK